MSFEQASSESMSSSLELFQTSLLLNSIILLTCILLFSFLRPTYPAIYAPRCLLKDAILLPNRMLSWITIGILKINDDTMDELVGIDGYLLIKFIKLNIHIFTIVTILGISILLPIHYHGSNNQVDFDLYSLSNIKDGSDVMWVHACGVWIITIIYLYYLNNMYSEFSVIRHKYLSLPLPKSYSILITELPDRLTDDSTLSNYFLNLYNHAVYSAHVLKDTTELDILVNEREEVANQLGHCLGYLTEKGERPTLDIGKQVANSSKKNIKSASSNLDSLYIDEQNGINTPKRQLKNGENDAIDFWAVKLNTLNHELKKAQREGAPPTKAGIVTFNTLQASTMCSQNQHSASISQMIVTPAPELSDIITENLNVSHVEKIPRVLLTTSIVFLLIFFFTIPIAFISSLSNLDELSKTNDGLKIFFDSLGSYARSVIQGFIPPVLLAVFLSLLPGILTLLSKYEGILSYSECQRSATDKFFLFQLFNAYLIYLISGSILSSIDTVVNSPTSIISILALAVPKVSSFFINYVMLQALGGFGIDLLRVGPLIVSNLMVNYVAVTEKEKNDAIQPGFLNYTTVYPPFLLIIIVSLTYATMSPIILPFALLFFVFGYVVFKYQLLYVYIPKFESGGLYWPNLYNRCIVALIVCQLTMIGVLNLKLAVGPSIFLIPLLILTIANWKLVGDKYEKVSTILPIEKAVSNEISNLSPFYNLHFLANSYLQKALIVKDIPFSLDLMFPPLNASSSKAKVVQEKEHRLKLMYSLTLASDAINEVQNIFNTLELPAIDLNEDVDVNGKNELGPSSTTSVVNQSNSAENISTASGPALASTSEDNTSLRNFNEVSPSELNSPLEVIHAQGIRTAPISFALVKDPGDVDSRPYFSMPIVGLDDLAKELSRQKRRKTIGKLTITVKEGREYPIMSDGSTDSLVKIAVGEHPEVKTEIAKRTCNPNYGESFIFENFSINQVSATPMKITVCQDKIFGDAIIGSKSFDIRTVMKSTQKLGEDFIAIHSIPFSDDFHKAKVTLKFKVDYYDWDKQPKEEDEPVSVAEMPRVLSCRKKAEENKFRFVLGDSNFSKHGNVNYVGKMIQKANSYSVVLADNVLLAEIKFNYVAELKKTAVLVKILNRYVNTKEKGSSGTSFSGLYSNSVVSGSGPVLSLCVESSSRPILEVHNSADFFAMISASETTPNLSTDLDKSALYIADFDYPMTLFLGFAIISALKSHIDESEL